MKQTIKAHRHPWHLAITGMLAAVLLLSACGNAMPDATGVSPSGSGDASAASTATSPAAEAATPSSQPAAPARILPEDAKKRLDAGESILLVDVRTEEEHLETRIPGSLLLPVDDIGKMAQTLLPDKNATLFVYCRSGRRSAIAADTLSALGYTSVFDLGGIIDWPYETESGPVKGE
mgnify:CR=1 FL=1